MTEIRSWGQTDPIKTTYTTVSTDCLLCEGFGYVGDARIGSSFYQECYVCDGEGVIRGGPLTRPSWDEYFLGIAQAVSARGDCIRRKVGAVLVDENNIQRGSGFNGSEPGGPSCLLGECPRCLNSSIPSGEQYDNCVERHAEDNMLRNSTIDIFPWKTLTAYITCPPCSNCKTLLFDAGVQKVVWPEGHLDLVAKL